MMPHQEFQLKTIFLEPVYYWDEDHPIFPHLIEDDSDFLGQTLFTSLQSQTPSDPPNHQMDQTLSLQSSQPEEPPIQKATSLKIGLSEKKEPKKNDYEKNICGYVIKRAAKDMELKCYRKKLSKLCEKEEMKVEDFLKFLKKIQKLMIGLTLLKEMIEGEVENEDEIGGNKVFLTFLEWFLREKYVVVLLGEGKMEQKRKYIEVKNRIVYLLKGGEVTWNTLTC